MNKNRVFTIIICLAALIRIVAFGDIPHGVNRDEAALGYNAYSILKTGRDEHGVLLPYQLESFGDWKKPVYVYMSTIPIALFGLSIESTRFVAYVFSLLMIIYIMRIVDFLTRNSKALSHASIWTGIFLSLNPWHFFFSRTASETLVASTFFFMGVYYLVKGRVFWSTVLCIVAMFTYHAALIYVPVWLGFQWVLNWKNMQTKEARASMILLSIVTAFLFYATFFSSEKAKASGLVIFDLSMAQNQALMDARTQWYGRLIHNRYVFIATTFIKNYSATFSSEFLLKKGSDNPTYNVPGFGYFYPIELLSALIGLYVIAKVPKKPKWLLVSLIAIAPLPAAITFEAVHAAREFMLVGGVAILAGLGVSWFISQSSVPLRGNVIIGLLLILSAGPFYYHYFADYRKQSDDVYHGYMKDIVFDAYRNEQEGKYDKIYMTDFRESPYIFYAFYNRVDPTFFQQNIEYYNPDFEGFVHAKQLGGIYFEERDEEAIALKEVVKGNHLNYSRPGSLEYWIKPLEVWDNLAGEKEIVSWQENQI